MCGRYVLASNLTKIAERFIAEMPEFDHLPRFNVAPGQNMPVITRKGKNQAQLMKWGLVPFWAPDIKIGYKMINARSETVIEKPAFRKPIKSQRCIIPSSGFYEWKQTPEGKVPHFIKLKDDPLFGFAGLYDVWKDVEGREILSYTILTTDANDAIRHLHNRMPVILAPEVEQAWMDQESKIEDVVSFLKPFPAEKMEAYAVSTKVNSARTDSPDLINRFEEKPNESTDVATLFS